MRRPPRLAALVLLVAVTLAACSGDSTSSSKSPSPSRPAPVTATPRDPSSAMFDPSVVHEVRLDITPDQQTVLGPAREERAHASVTVDGAIAPNVGVRLKQGLGSYRDLNGKPSFTVKTDEFVDDLALFGEKKFSLNSEVGDPSFVSESVTYEAFRAAGIPAPRTALANVYLNGELLGLYVLREALDKRFLERNFENPSGNLYEAPLDVDLADTRMELRTNEARNDKSDVAALQAVVDGTPDASFVDAAGRLVDLDELFRYWALEALTAHWDGYLALSGIPFWDPSNTVRNDNYRPNNFYAYFDPQRGKFVVLPWGADQTLGTGFDAGSGLTTKTVLPPKEDAHLVVRLYSQPDGPARYRATLLDVLDHSWDTAALVARAEMLGALVRSTGLTSPREETTMDGFERALADRLTFLRERATVVRAELAAAPTG